MLRQVHLTIHGEVVGVFFRASARERAEALGLTGWGQNRDGAVEIAAQGEEEQLKKFLAWCKEGPKWAKVNKVEVEWQEPHEKWVGFEIR